MINVMHDLVAMGVDYQAGLDYTGGKEKYISALQRFYKSSEKNRDTIQRCLQTGDLENLGITVHALKSNAKMIGAGALSDMFLTLETAAKNEDMNTIQANIGKTMDAYDRLLAVIKPWGETQTFRAAGELSPEEAKDTANRLLTALDDYDDDLAAQLTEKLSGYPFRITQRNKLQEAVEMVGDFMYEEAADLIREIIPHIE